jgi:hypothetical protein
MTARTRRPPHSRTQAQFNKQLLPLQRDDLPRPHSSKNREPDDQLLARAKRPGNFPVWAFGLAVLLGINGLVQL